MKSVVPIALMLLVSFRMPVCAQGVCENARAIFEAVEAHHVQPLAMDDSLSARVFDQWLLLLDNDKVLFTTEDVASISHLRLQLDNKLQTNTCDFTAIVAQLYLKKLVKTRQRVDSLLGKPMNFDSEAFIDILPPSGFASAKANRQRLSNLLRSHVLQACYRKALSLDTPFTATLLTSLEAEARLRVKRKYTRPLESAIENAVLRDSLVVNAFYKAIARAFDPHTTYFSPAEMEAFTSTISDQLLSFGFNLNTNANGEIVVGKLIPGGAAWLSNELHEGDVVHLVETNGNQYDLLDFDEQEAQQVLDETLAPLTITVRKGDGKISKVTLVKARIENYENTVSGFLLKGDRKIGYIQLPGFFTASENESVSGCANVVARELIKLKNEGIEGLILDLRFNGGGSMKEAVELAGIFIDNGPMAILKENGQPPFTLKDFFRGAAYTGPLVVMINGASASASELVAAVLQDYNRAYIIGTTSFGKATGQTILPVHKDNNSYGYVKVTVDKLYRVTGSSLQRQGVMPDIELPDATESLVGKEKLEPYALAAERITKKVYFTPSSALPLQRVKEQSNLRVNSSAKFTAVTKLRTQLRSPLPLQRDAFVEFMNELNTLFQNESDNSAPYQVLNARQNNMLLSVDEFKARINQQTLEQIQNSFYIREAYFVLNDVIQYAR